MLCAIWIQPLGRDVSRLKWRQVSHTLILGAFKNWETDESLCVCGCVLDGPHCPSPWTSQRGSQNQCELFIHGSNPQLYCHLLCGYGRSLMTLMLSNRCPCSAPQVGLHLVTPLSPGTRWPTAPFVLSSGGSHCLNTCIITSRCINRENQAKC